MKNKPARRASAPPASAPAPDLEEVYPIAVVVKITRTPRRLIAVYCQHGLITPVASVEEEHWQFDDAAIYELRRLSWLRAEYDLAPAALRLLVETRREIDRLRAEVRFLRGR